MHLSPIVTTIILTYRRPHLLKKAIESVLNQTYSNFRLLICDNASGDETAAIVAKYLVQDSRVKYYCHDANIGMIENYKFGLSLIQSEYFSFLSDDDVLLPWFYETALTHLSDIPQAGFFAGSTILMSQKGRVKYVPFSLWKREGIFNVPDGMLEMIGKYPVPTGVLFSKKILEHVKIDENNPLTWDCDYLLHAASHFPFYISKKPCALFLQHTECYSTSRNLESWKNAFYRLVDRVENNSALPPHIAKEAKNRILLDFYKWNLDNKKFEEASTIAKLLTEHVSPIMNIFHKKSKFRFIIYYTIHFLRKLKRRMMLVTLQQQNKKYYKFLR